VRVYRRAVLLLFTGSSSNRKLLQDDVARELAITKVAGLVELAPGNGGAMDKQAHHHTLFVNDEIS